jgi:hypothetical protein
LVNPENEIAGLVMATIVAPPNGFVVAPEDAPALVPRDHSTSRGYSGGSTQAHSLQPMPCARHKVIFRV